MLVALSWRGWSPQAGWQCGGRARASSHLQKDTPHGRRPSRGGCVGVASPPSRLTWPPGHVNSSHVFGVSPAPSLCGGAWQVYVSAGASSHPPSRHRNPLTLGASLGGTAQVSRGWGIHTIPFISPRSEIPSRLIEGSFQFLLPVGRSNKFWQYFCSRICGASLLWKPRECAFPNKKYALYSA